MYNNLVKTSVMLLVFLLCCAVLVPDSLAQPKLHNAPSALSDGEFITITGEGFGDKAIAGPLRWETFEDGVDGADITSTGYWSRELKAASTFNGSSQRHARSTLNFRHHLISITSNGITYKHVAEWATSRKKFVSLWKKIDFVSVYPGQFKSERIESTATHGSSPMVIIDTWANADNTAASQYYLTLYRGGLVNLGRKDPPSSYRPQANTWYNVVFQYQESTYNNNDGNCTVYVSSTYPEMPYWKGKWTNMLTQSNVGQVVQYLKLGYNIESGGVEANSYYDDIYIDNSWARVEIGDAATYDSCTHREIQIPASWSNSSITVKINQGSFLTSHTYYLYVIDENGSVNFGGYPITLTAKLDTLPGSPQNLRITQ